MNTMLDLQDKIRTTGSSMGRLEGAFARKPSRSLEANILSLRKLHGSLEREFAAAADVEGFEVCHYRVLNDRPTVRSVSDAIGRFQDAIAQAYDAIRHGPKKRKTLSADTALFSEMQVAYSFPGSFGLAFTIPNNRMLFDMATQLDKAAVAVFDVVTAETTANVTEAVTRYGRASVIATYDWAKANTEHGVGAGIEWVRGENMKREVIVQAPQFAAISAKLEATKESDSVPVTLGGILVGADIRSGRFHFVPDNYDGSIHGTFHDAISEAHQARLPSRYMAVMIKTVETHLATESERESYFLERLETR